MKIFFRYLKRLVIFIICVLIILITWSQIEAEKYIIDQKKKYLILNKKERINYELFASFIINNKFFLNYSIDFQALHLPQPEIETNYIIIPMYNAYIVHCYYTEEEKLEYLSGFKWWRDQQYKKIKK